MTTMTPCRPRRRAPRLAAWYRDGEGLARNAAEGEAWWRKAAAQGYARAHFALGMAQHMGDDGKPDLEQAIGWYRKAAGLGLANAQHMLGVLLLEGVGTAAEQEEARGWLRKASEQGLGRAQADYGAILLDDPSRGAAQQGVALLRMAVAQDDPSGQSYLARCYETGRGVPRDERQARLLYEKAALRGDKAAQRSMANIYERGIGVAADPVRAAEWRKAAEVPVPRPR